MTAVVVTTALLFGLWVLLTGADTPGGLLLGLLLAAAAAVLTVARLRRRLGPQLRPLPAAAGRAARGLLLLRRLWALLTWLRRLVADIVVANFRIAAMVLAMLVDRRRQPQPVEVVLPVALESPLGIYLLAATISLTPGTVTVDLAGSEVRRRLLVHAIDRSEVTGEDGGPAVRAPDAERWAATVKARYEAPLLEVFR
jgi:multicomponent K+:H+ antiporter subunit E